MKVAILLHMHQPPYGLRAGQGVHYSMPWVLTHLMREYFDVAYTLSQLERPILTINFSGSLLEQIEDYTRGSAVDRFFEIFKKMPEELEPDEKIFLVENFFSVNFETRIKPFKRYKELYYRRGSGKPEERLMRFTDQDLMDLQVLFFLSQVSTYYQEGDDVIKELKKKGKGYTQGDKEVLSDRIREIINRVIPLYKNLTGRGLSVSFTPYNHPILPLIQSTTVARESNPSCEMPEVVFSSPEDVEKQIRMGKEIVEKYFGPVRGSWPAEGGVSSQVVKKYKKQGVEWIATDEEILHRSLKKRRESSLFAGIHAYRGYIHHGVKIYFRDHVLSDLIGFVYSRWDPNDAVDDFIKRLSEIERISPDAIVSIILDGENPWEYYPDGGVEFLSLLVDEVGKRFEISVFDELDASEELDYLHPGSWIDGNFNTWICDHEKNIAWVYLSRVKSQVYHEIRSRPDAEKEWLKSEASDWFWWLGEDHPSIYAREFDRIFREHLKKVYEILDLIPPEFLDIPIKQGESEGEVIPPWRYSTPEIDGKITTYYEWLGAGEIRPYRVTMGLSSDPVKRIMYIFDDKNLYLLVDFGEERAEEILKSFMVEIEISGGEGNKILRIDEKEGSGKLYSWKARSKLEIAINRKVLDGTETPAIRMRLYKNGKVQFTYPDEGYYILRSTRFDPDAVYW